MDDRNLTAEAREYLSACDVLNPDSPQPVEVVINNISKDHIHGYVSASKYRQSEVSSMANGGHHSSTLQATDAGPIQTASDEQTAPRQKLPNRNRLRTIM